MESLRKTAMKKSAISRRQFVALGLAGSACLLMGHSPYGQWFRFRGGRLVIGTDKQSAHAVTLANAIAQVLAAYRPETKAIIGTTPTSLDTVKLLKSEQVYVALLMADEAWEASVGTGNFSGWDVPLTTLAVLDSHLFHVVTLAPNGMRRVADLKGKRVAAGLPGDRAETKLRRILEAYGIDASRDLREEPLDLSAAVNALKAGKIDAWVQDGPIPNMAIRDLAATPGMAVQLLSNAEAIPRMRDPYGRVYGRGMIPKGTYAGLEHDVAVMATTHLLVCREDFPRDRAYELAQTLSEYKAEWAPSQQGVHDPSSRVASLEASIPLHPGALDYLSGRKKVVRSQLPAEGDQHDPGR
jgi:uncharacterized protein